ncbi:MAG: TolB-like protein/Tfp pilus assembly protein PilF [Polaribacter sp.]|jgi:TolB-like protein/Tfp pilus assembly protein PilF
MSLFKELKRRNVFKVAGAYVIVSWLVIQVVSSVTPMLNLPEVFGRMVLVLLLIGFPIAAIFAWAFEMTPEGIKKESEVERDESITETTGKKLEYSIIGLLVIALGYFVWNSQTTEQPEPAVQPKISSTPTDNPQIETVREKSIAVLPFTNMANNPESEPITVGLHDDLLTHISKISALKVISRTSVLRYKDTKESIATIAKELGVANILEGGVQKSGNQIRINVQLIDAQTDEHIWAEIFDRELTASNIFKVQTEISKKIAAALKAQLTKAENQSISSIPTDNLEAYNAYLAGRQLLAKRDSDSLKKARTLFQRATELDPNYAQAYVGEANSLRLLSEYSDLPQEQMFNLGEPLIAKALALNPLLADAQTTKAAYLDEAGDFEAAEKNYLYALSLNPNNAQAYHWYGHMLRNDLGRFEEALAIHRKAAELEPLSSIILNNVGWSLRSTGQLQAALSQYQTIYEKSPGFPAVLTGLAWVNDDLGNFALAVSWQNKAVELDTANILNRYWLAWHYLNLGDLTAAQAELEKAKRITPTHGTYGFWESKMELFAGGFEAAQLRFTTALERDSTNILLQKNLARFTLLNSDCESVINLWQSAAPENFGDELRVDIMGLYDQIDIAWCLKQTNQAQAADQLLAKAEDILKKNPTEIYFRLFSKAGILAVQGKPQAAAQAYANTVASKRTRGWYWVDHLPYFTEMRKQPVFIKAREQLMQQLAQQRELLAEYRKNEKT